MVFVHVKPGHVLKLTAGCFREVVLSLSLHRNGWSARETEPIIHVCSLNRCLKTARSILRFLVQVCVGSALKDKKRVSSGKVKASAPEREERCSSPQRLRDIGSPRSDTVENSPVT